MLFTNPKKNTNKGDKMKQDIIKNRDDKGRILTYTATTPNGVKVECNTLKEARLFHKEVEQ